MPSLKDLHCFVELPEHRGQLQEFGTVYGNGSVETFISVPSRPQAFAVRLKSSDFVAPGLAMYVFIDGVYQCNRNRQGLKLRRPPDKNTLVEFCVRQKEDQHKHGSMTAHDWTLEKLDVEAADRARNHYLSSREKNVGCIEVVVLRCAGSRGDSVAKPTDGSKANSMNMDGAYDVPDDPSWMNEQTDPSRGPYGSSYHGDWGWSEPRSIAGFPGADGARLPSATAVDPFFPPPSYPYDANTFQNHGGNATDNRRTGRSDHQHSHPNWKDTQSASPWLQSHIATDSIPYRYSRGQFTPTPRATSFADFPPSGAVADTALCHPQELTTALQGAANFQNIGNTFGKPCDLNMYASEASRQPPGAWPISPFGPAPTLHEDVTATLQDYTQSSNHAETRSRHTPASGSAAHLDWGQPIWSAAASRASNANGWNWHEHDEKSSSSSTTESWGHDQKNNGRRSFDLARDRHQVHSAFGGAKTRAPSIEVGLSDANGWDRSATEDFVKSRPHVPQWESDEDQDGWTRVEADSHGDYSWDAVQPNDSISAVVSKASHSYDIGLRGKSTFEKEFGIKPPPPPPFVRKHGTVPDGISPFGVTFDNSLWKMSSKCHGPQAWGIEDANAETPSWDTSWDTSDSHEVRSHTGKETVTVVDRRNKFRGWGEAVAKDAQPSDWNPINDKSCSGWNANVQGLRGGWYSDADFEVDKRTKGKSDGWPAEAAKYGCSQGSDSPGTSRDWNIGLPRINGTRGSNGMNANVWGDLTLPTNSGLEHSTSRRCQMRLSSTENIHHKDRRGHVLPAQKKGFPTQKGPTMQAQAQESEGVKYGHTIGRPKYLDTLEKPYAVFRFKYRSRRFLKNLLGDQVPDHGPLVYKVSDESRDRSKVLRPKAIVDNGLKLRAKLSEEEHMAEEANIETVGRDRTMDWVKRQSRGTSGMAKGEGKGGRDGDWNVDVDVEQKW